MFSIKEVVFYKMSDKLYNRNDVLLLLLDKVDTAEATPTPLNSKKKKLYKK